VLVLPIVTSDNHTASTCLLALLDQVNFAKAFTRISGFQLFGEIVISDTASIDNRAGRKDILSNSVLDRGYKATQRRTAAPRAAFCAAPPATYVIL
jgi:hypothetical protein